MPNVGSVNYGESGIRASTTYVDSWRGQSQSSLANTISPHVSYGGVARGHTQPTVNYADTVRSNITVNISNEDAMLQEAIRRSSATSHTNNDDLMLQHAIKLSQQSIIEDEKRR